MNSSVLLKTSIIEPIGKLQQAGFYSISFILMAQAIEFMGGMLDKKPFRAREQSKKRFNLAINKLFGEKYRFVNQNDWLYDKLRNHLTHTFIPSSWLILCSRSDSGYGTHHLKFENDRLILVAEDLYDDLTSAAETILKKIEKGEIGDKAIEFKGI
jgi:hypothetical protein